VPLLSEAHDLDAGDARKWRDHPAQFWLERAITSGLAARGGSASKVGKAWRVKWADGSESAHACFDARTADENPELDWVTLEDPRARAVISELPRFVAGQPLPVIRVTGLPDSVRGIWSLWEISLVAEGLSRKRFLPVFVTEDGRTFVPTAKRVWDLLLTETVDVHAVSGAEDAVRWFEASQAAARAQGERIFKELLDEHRTRLKEERERASYAFEARSQAIGRIGLPAVREHRRKRLQQEHDARMASLDDAEASVPDLNAVMLVRVFKDVLPGGTTVMSQWTDRILSHFTADLTRLWVACDPDDVLLDEKLLAELRGLGFEVMLYEDPFAFRAEFEERFRGAWDRGEAGPAPSLVLHLRNADQNVLPWDIVHHGRVARLSLAELFPRLAYSTVKQVEPEHLAGIVRCPRNGVAVGSRRERVQGLHPRTRLPTYAKIHPHAGRLLARIAADALCQSLIATTVCQTCRQHPARQRIVRGSACRGVALIEERAAACCAGCVVPLPHWHGAGWLPHWRADRRRTTSPRSRFPLTTPMCRCWSTPCSSTAAASAGRAQRSGCDAELDQGRDRSRPGCIAGPGAQRRRWSDRIDPLRRASSHKDWSEFAKRYGEILARAHGLPGAEGSEQLLKMHTSDQ
jgi:hypothetical protein